MIGNFWLSDQQFALIQPHLPYRAAGRRRADDRRIISGILHVLQSGCRWQDCPDVYGPHTTVYNRFNSPLKKALLTGFHSTAKHNATKAVSPSSETMRTI